MPKGRWLTCCWPGLAELWLVGSWSALATAVGFAILLNLALAVSLVWTQLLTAEVRFALWTAVGSLWVFGVWTAWRTTLARPEPDGDLFSRALGEYLQGNWFAAEALLEQLLKADARDIEAQLLLATLFRRTARLQESRTQLDRLSRSPGSEKWLLEIQRERLLLDATPATTQEPAEPPLAAAEPTTTLRAA